MLVVLVFRGPLLYGRFEERQYHGVEPAGRGPGGVLVGLPGGGVGPADAQVGGELEGEILGCVVGEARGWVLSVSSVVEGDPLGFG